MVHVHEARKLLKGDNNPLVRVACGSISKETTSRYSTDHPEFEEVRVCHTYLAVHVLHIYLSTFSHTHCLNNFVLPASSLKVLFFNFSETPQEMFDRMVEFKVLHSRAVVRNPLLGSFKVSYHNIHVCMYFLCKYTCSYTYYVNTTVYIIHRECTYIFFLTTVIKIDFVQLFDFFNCCRYYLNNLLRFFLPKFVTFVL